MYSWNVCVAPRVDSPQNRWSWREMLLLDQRRSAAAASSTSASTYIPFRIGRGVCVGVTVICRKMVLCNWLVQFRSRMWNLPSLFKPQLDAAQIMLPHNVGAFTHDTIRCTLQSCRRYGSCPQLPVARWPHLAQRVASVVSVLLRSLFSGAVGWVGIYLWFISLCTVWKEVGFFFSFEKKHFCFDLFMDPGDNFWQAILKRIRCLLVLSIVI